MFTEQLKSVLDHLAWTVKNIHHFSLIPKSKDYKDIETITKELGGSLVFHDGTETDVCRCGTSFIIRIPNTKIETYKLRCFAEALAILFLEIRYMMSDNDFMKHEDMVCETIYRRDYDDYKALIYLTDEFLCPKEELKKTTISLLHDDGTFCINEVAKAMGLDYSYIELRLVQCHLMERRL